MKIKNHIIFVVLCAFTILSGCAQWTITGQNTLWKPKETSSQTNGCSLVGIYSNTAGSSASGTSAASVDTRIIDTPDAFSISLKTLYLKYIQDFFNFDVIVYAEVYEVDETNVLRRIAFHRENQPPTSYLNIADALLYGPVHFNGNPITVKFYVLELDKKENSLFSELLNVVSSVAGKAQPQYGPAIQVAASIMQLVINMNQDDIELFQEMTFYPSLYSEKSHYAGASLLSPLETGDFVIVKKEDEDRVVINRWWRLGVAKRAEDAAKNVFETNNDVYEIYYNPATGRLLKHMKEQPGQHAIIKNFEDKTYAVLTVSKSGKAADRAVLEKISTNAQATLSAVSINFEMSEKEKLDTIKRMGANAEATIELFNIKNRISGKTPQEKQTILNEYITKTDMGTETTNAKVLVRYGLQKLLEEIEDKYRLGTSTTNQK